MKKKLNVGDTIEILKESDHFSSQSECEEPLDLIYPIKGEVTEIIKSRYYTHLTVVIDKIRYGFSKKHTDYRILKQETNINQSII